jgi:hypothetical protein
MCIRFVVLYVLNFRCLDRTWDSQIPELNGSNHFMDLNCSQFDCERNLYLLSSFKSS